MSRDPFDFPPLHPMLADPIESGRCPDCGEPGLPVRPLLPGITIWACPSCEPEAFGEGGR